MDEPLVQLTSHFGALFLFLVAITTLLHIPFCFGFKGSKRFWKKTDYVWLSFAALGLVKYTSDARVLVANNSKALATLATQSALSRVRELLIIDPPSYFCIHFVRSEFSPPDFDEIQKEHEVACNWIKHLPPILPPTDDPPFPPLSFEALHPPEELQDEGIREGLRWIREAIRDYENRRKELAYLETLSHRTNGEEIHQVLTPLLLAFAIAIRLTKVTGEVRLEP